jgi:hypothetical protein
MSETFDFSKIKKLVAGLSDQRRVQVGIFGNKDARQKGGQSNAYIGSIHEFGWPPSHIPKRSFLRMPVVVKGKDIAKEAGQGAEQLLASGKIDLLLKRLGIAAEKFIQEAFVTRGFGTWPPDKDATVRRKGNKKGEDSPLIDTGQLRRSITSRVAEK